jgi:hypothetical protein
MRARVLVVSLWMASCSSENGKGVDCSVAGPVACATSCALPGVESFNCDASGQAICVCKPLLDMTAAVQDAQGSNDLSSRD